LPYYNENYEGEIHIISTLSKNYKNVKAKLDIWGQMLFRKKCLK